MTQIRKQKSQHKLAFYLCKNDCWLPNAEENHHAHDEREDANQVHAPHDLGIHKRLAGEASFPLLLVVVVERGAKENALAFAGGLFGELEPANLEQYGASFGDDDDANNGEEKSCLHQDEHDADGGAKPYGTGVAHVDFGRRAVEPQVGEECACNRHGERE